MFLTLTPSKLSPSSNPKPLFLAIYSKIFPSRRTFTRRLSSILCVPLSSFLPPLLLPHPTIIVLYCCILPTSSTYFTCCGIDELFPSFSFPSSRINSSLCRSLLYLSFRTRTIALHLWHFLLGTLLVFVSLRVNTVYFSSA